MNRTSCVDQTMGFLAASLSLCLRSISVPMSSAGTTCGGVSSLGFIVFSSSTVSMGLWLFSEWEMVLVQGISVIEQLSTISSLKKKKHTHICCKLFKLSWYVCYSYLWQWWSYRHCGIFRSFFGQLRCTCSIYEYYSGHRYALFGEHMIICFWSIFWFW